MSLILILSAIALVGLSGSPGLFLNRCSPIGQRTAAMMMSCGAVLGLAGAGMELQGENEASFTLPSFFMGGGLTLGVDALSAFFLIPIFAMGGLGSLYGLDYWRYSKHMVTGRNLSLFWGLLVASMAVLVMARHALLFLLGWEVMALSAFFLIGTEDHLSEVRGAAWLYLIATHIGTLSLFGMFCLLRLASGSFDLKPVPLEAASLGHLTAIFSLAILGFGLKAGLMPFHFWLPDAHASAPSHVSAILSGVVIKMGVYGLIRITGFLPQPPVAWGAILLILGSVSGVLGVAFAIGQHDLKRLLAYHSVENIGIIVMGLGLAMIGRSMGQIEWVMLGLAGCLLHVWNHGVFKSLLFLGAGSVVHATNTRNIDKLGGLSKSMPMTSFLFLIGAVAICGLPPLNGFVSEFFIYLGFLRTTGIGGSFSWTGAAVGFPILALIGALAVACFVKVYGTVFLGASRSDATTHARESGWSMLTPMITLAGCCVVIGLFPFGLTSILSRAVCAWNPEFAGMGDRLAPLAPLGSIATMNVALWLLLAVVAALVLMKYPVHGITRTCTWDCGYARPTPRMQYTSSSFAELLVKSFRWPLRPRSHKPEIHGVFASSSQFRSHVGDVVLDGQIRPAWRVTQRVLNRLRGLQPGLAQHYLLYILLTVLAMLLWTLPFGQILERLFSR